MWNDEDGEWTLPAVKPRPAFSQVVKLPGIGRATLEEAPPMPSGPTGGAFVSDSDDDDARAGGHTHRSLGGGRPGSHSRRLRSKSPRSVRGASGSSREAPADGDKDKDKDKEKEKRRRRRQQRKERERLAMAEAANADNEVAAVMRVTGGSGAAGGAVGGSGGSGGSVRGSRRSGGPGSAGSGLGRPPLAPSSTPSDSERGGGRSEGELMDLGLRRSSKGSVRDGSGGGGSSRRSGGGGGADGDGGAASDVDRTAALRAKGEAKRANLRKKLLERRAKMDPDEAAIDEALAMEETGSVESRKRRHKHKHRSKDRERSKERTKDRDKDRDDPEARERRRAERKAARKREKAKRRVSSDGGDTESKKEEEVEPGAGGGGGGGGGYSLKRGGCSSPTHGDFPSPHTSPKAGDIPMAVFPSQPAALVGSSPGKPGGGRGRNGRKVKQPAAVALVRGDSEVTAEDRKPYAAMLEELCDV